MDSRELKHRAAEAHRLLTDPLLLEGLNHILAAARDELEICAPEDLLKMQAKAWAARSLPDWLDEQVKSAPSTESPDKPDPDIV